MPHFPRASHVVAIDSTSLALGQLSDGLVGAVRASVILKPPGRTDHRLERYGPYLVEVTNQNKDAKYRKACTAVYGPATGAVAPDCAKTLDRMRTLLERQLQLEAVKQYEDSLILLDGSLIGGAVGDPLSVMRSLKATASSRGNALAAISKATLRRNTVAVTDYAPLPDHLC